ncbi:MAG: hypothetical protein LBO65_04310 [Spirochaetaceae bacterium]|nr:hypothetical protein [Spirochaetaceae bacterium]
MGCAKPELTVWSAYPEYKELFTAAGEAYQKLRINYLAPGEEPPEPGLFVFAGDDMETFIAAGLGMDMEEAFAALEAENPEAGDFRRRIPLYYREGRPWGLFLNSGTGVLCYDPELTGRYLHVSEPALVQEQLGDLNSFIVSAFLVGERSFGSCAVIPAAEELLPAFQHTKSVALQRAGLKEEERERWFNDIAGLFEDRRWEGLEFEDGKPRRILAFFLGPGSSFTAPGGGAGWRIIRGPDPESNGGLWIALHRDLFTGKKKKLRQIRGYLDVLLRSLIPDSPTASGTSD